MITPGTMAACAGASEADARVWFDPICAAMRRFNIDTIGRGAAFLAQIGHESGGLHRVRENLNYTPESLLATFGKRITKTDAYRYGRTAEHPADQRTIACIVYAGRMGNGPMESGDGWRYRGGGPGQLTGRENYTRCGTAIGVDLADNPELIERPTVGALAFGWFWDANELNGLADTGDIDQISRRVNGGDNGLAKRREMYEHALQILEGDNA